MGILPIYFFNNLVTCESLLEYVIPGGRETGVSCGWVWGGRTRWRARRTPTAWWWGRRTAARPSYHLLSLTGALYTPSMFYKKHLYNKQPIWAYEFFDKNRKKHIKKQAYAGILSVSCVSYKPYLVYVFCLLATALRKRVQSRESSSIQPCGQWAWSNKIRTTKTMEGRRASFSFFSGTSLTEYRKFV